MHRREKFAFICSFHLLLWFRFFVHQLIRVVDHLPQLFSGERMINNNSVPVALIHVVSRYDARVLITQLNSTLRIALYIELERITVEAEQKKYLSLHFEHKCFFPEREAFFHFWLSECVLPYLFHVHVTKVKKGLMVVGTILLNEVLQSQKR